MNWRQIGWAVFFAITMVYARMLINSAIPSFVNICLMLTAISTMALLLILIASRLSRISSALWITLACFVYLGAFRYEAMFGSLPGPEILFYTQEITHLLPSLLEVIDLMFIVSLLAASTVLVVSGNFCRINQTDTSRAAAFTAMALLTLSAGQWFFLPSTSQASDPIAWWVGQHLRMKQAPQETDELFEADYKRFLGFHGIERSGIDDLRFPLCHTPLDASRPTDQSAIVLVLENVGLSEMSSMPNLMRFANQHLWFKDFMSAGTKSVQAMPAFFSGLPPNPQGNYLWRRPLPNMPSVARTLSQHGYETAYFHGSDLSFEQQRHYLQRAEFKNIFELGDYDYPIYGWGYDDKSMLSELQRWVEQQQSPYFAALATLSTHHPYELPQNNTGQNTRLNMTEKQALAYQFLDDALGTFFSWFEAQDALLIIVGDHAPDFGDQQQRFKIPFIIAGAEQEDTARNLTEKKGISYDLPNTLMNALGLPDLPCSPGHRLLASYQGTADRVRYTVAGNALEAVYLHDLATPVAFNKSTFKFHEVASSGGLGNTIDISEVPETTIDVFQSIMRVHHFLLEENAYSAFPKNAYSPVPKNAYSPVPINAYSPVPINAYSPVPINAYSPVQEVTASETDQAGSNTETIFVSHRGNTRGEDPTRENTREAISDAISADMEWVEIDIQVDRNGLPFLFHDPEVLINEEVVRLGELTIDEIRGYGDMANVMTLEEATQEFSSEANLAIELKPVDHIAKHIGVTQRVRHLINSRPGNRRIILDSFNSTLLQSIQKDCRCEVGIDHPYREPVNKNDLQHYASLGYDWLYLEQSVVNAELIDRAHRHGLKVMAYTINSPDALNPLLATPPDGIITDHSELKDQWQAMRAKASD